MAARMIANDVLRGHEDGAKAKVRLAILAITAVLCYNVAGCIQTCI